MLRFNLKNIVTFFMILILGGCHSGNSSTKLSSLSVSPTTSIITAGATQQYTVKATYSNGTSSPLTNGIKWKSSNTAVATINNNGLATIIAASGSTNITATYNGVTSKPVTLKATNATVTAITLSPVNSEISHGLTHQYSVQAIYSDGTSSPPTSGVEWKSSDTAVATIDSNGLATVIAPSGSTKITATYNGVTSAAVTLNATNAKVTAITLSPDNSEISHGLTQQYAVQATYSDGANSSLTSGVEWKSSDTAVATIDGNGLATVLESSGSTKITASYNGVPSAPVTLNATNAKVTAITLSPDDSEISHGLTHQYSVQATYSNGTSSLLTSGITWNLSDTTVATIDANGLAIVTASSGSANITATYNGITSPPVVLKATNAKITAITLSPNNSQVTEELTQQYTAVATYSNGESSPLTSGVRWRSSNTAVAIIYSNGLATVRVPSGSTNITATYNGVTSAPAILEAVSREWKSVGSDIPKDSSGFNLKMALNPLGIPYIAYQKYSSNAITSMKLDGTQWKSFGQPLYSSPGTNIAFGINPDSHVPYLFIVDPSVGNPGVVIKLNENTHWDAVGNHLGTITAGSKQSLRFGSDGTPYLSYATGNYFAIAKFKNGSWALVGQALVNTSQYVSFELDSKDVPYITYEDNQTRVVKKFLDGAWLTVGDASSCPTGARVELNLNFRDAPYLACTQLDTRSTPNKIRTTVLKLEDGSWKPLMPVTSYLYTAVLFNISPSNGAPYLALWTTGSQNIAVLKFNGSEWISSGSIDLPSNNINDINFIFDKNTPYIAYSDALDGGKIHVMSYR